MSNTNSFSGYISDLRGNLDRGDETDRVIFGEEYGRPRAMFVNPHTPFSDLQIKNQKSTISNPLVGGYQVCEKSLKDRKGRPLDYAGEGVYADGMALENRMEPWGVITFHDGNNPSVQEGIFRSSNDWKRPHRLMHLACDTITQPPEGVFAGISLILVAVEHTTQAPYPDSGVRGKEEEK